MQIQYLEIVTRDVNAVCAAYSLANGVQFGEPDPELGNARTATLAGGGWVGVRAPLRKTEEPEIPGRGTFAIYLQGGNDHGLWRRESR